MKILLYTNILTPYRKYFYDVMAQYCKDRAIDFSVLVMAQTENNRPWMYEQYSGDYTELLEGRTISHGETYIHINPNLKKKLQEEKPDIVIAAGSYLCPGTWMIAKLKSQLGYTTLFWSESHLAESRGYSGLKIKIRNYIRSKFYRKYDAFLCPGELAMEFVKTYAGKEAKCILLPNLIEEKNFRGLEEGKKRTNEAISFFTPARLSPVKGILEFINILGMCPSKDKVTWFIAGEGELKEAIENAAIKNQVSVKLLGQKNQSEVIDLYRDSDIFVLPSLSDPNPLTSIEALWMGKPLLVTNHVGNYPEVVDQGVNGYVISYGDLQKAISSIESVINCSSEWIKAASSRSKQMAASIFDSKKATAYALEKMLEFGKEIKN